MLEVKILDGNTALRRTFRKIPASVFLPVYSLEYTDFTDVLEKHRAGFKAWLTKTVQSYKIEFLVTPLYKNYELIDSFILENEIIVWIGDNRIRTKLFFMDDIDDYRLCDIINPRHYGEEDYDEFIRAEKRGKGLCIMDCLHIINETYTKYEHGKASEELTLGLTEDSKYRGENK